MPYGHSINNILSIDSENLFKQRPYRWERQGMVEIMGSFFPRSTFNELFLKNRSDFSCPDFRVDNIVFYCSVNSHHNYFFPHLTTSHWHFQYVHIHKNAYLPLSNRSMRSAGQRPQIHYIYLLIRLHSQRKIPIYSIQPKCDYDFPG